MLNHESKPPLIGLAKLMRMTYSGCDLAPLGTQLIERATTDTSGHTLMDLSTVLQLRGNRDLALALQAQAIESQQIYSTPTTEGQINVRLLAIMGAGDLMANTPVEFLLEDSDVALDIVYVTEDLPLPDQLPDHDVLFIAIAQSDQNMKLLQAIEAAITSWPRPVLNKPERIALMSRNAACALLKSVPGVAMPITARIARQLLEQIANEQLSLTDIIEDGTYPIIVRPVDSHAGQGLDKIDDAHALLNYLQVLPHSEFYVSRFVDYRGQDGLFRKYRIVLIDGKPYACHLGISEHWMIHYLNAGMAESCDKRAEEARFMSDFDSVFADKHASALTAIYERVGLDYLGIDCGETADGLLLIFEIDSCMIIHAIDPVEVFPYKQPQMNKVFGAFRRMLQDAMQHGVDLNLQNSSLTLDSLPSTEQLLIAGGDTRIALDPQSGLNKYGCTPFPDPQLLAFGSSTASVISTEGYTVANRLRQKWLDNLDTASYAAVYARHLQLVRLEWLQLCELSDISGLELVLMPSGTDIHALAAGYAGSNVSASALAIMVEADETGSGVAAALNVNTGVGANNIEVLQVSIRLADGRPRPLTEIDADVAALVGLAVAADRRVLLILADQSKTGLIAPGLACVMALHRRYPDHIEVLVDACQFRIAMPTLRAYLQQGFMVALTGSKFLAAPSFSAVLLLPATAAERLKKRAPPPYSCPGDETTAEYPDHAANFGLLLRWAVALDELRRFRAVPKSVVIDFLLAFAEAIQQRLTSDPHFEPLAVPRLDRSALIKADNWDHLQTIFPFLLYHPQSAERMPLSREQTRNVYQGLQSEPCPAAIDPPESPIRCQLGQPVACGFRKGIPVSALRLCISSRLIIEAATRGDKGDGIIKDALAALDKTALLIRSGLVQTGA